MILTDREIKIALQHELISIDPRPNDNAYSSTSIDLTLDPVLSEFHGKTSGIKQEVDPGEAGFSHEDVLKALTQQVHIPDEGYRLEPGKLVLAWTVEYVDLKHYARIAARVEGKSSLARLGLAVHVTAPTIHAGFAGRIRLEVVNHGPLPIRLRKNMPFCQLILEQTLGTPEKGYQGRFAGQTTAKRG